MKVLQTATFYRSVKRLAKNQKKTLDTAVQTIASNPSIGEKKKGDLKEIYVYKFRMLKQQILLAYTHQKRTCILILLTFGSHDNFYRNLKKSTLHTRS